MKSECFVSLSCCIHRQSPALGVLHHLDGLLLQKALLIGFGREGDAVRLAVVVLVEVGEGGEAVGSHFLRLTAAVHLGVDGQGAAPHMDDLALEGDDVARENRELEVDAVEYQKDGVLRVNILRHSEIGTFQDILGATTCEEGLVMIQVSELDKSLGIS